jgi:membrane-bound ClpP family serine protease
MRLTPPIIVGRVFAAAFINFVIYAIVKDLRRKVSTGVEKMIGKKAVVQTTLNPKGMVLARENYGQP